jgi:SAM-dependent methyltransferase
MILTPSDRAGCYTRAFPNYPAVWSDKGWLMGQWNMGNNYQGSGYHGSYPPAYLKRVLAMFPDVNPRRTLHAFSGSLPRGGAVRVDRRADPGAHVVPDVQANVEQLPFPTGAFDLVLADPPYSQEDANHYGVPMVDRRRAFSECVRVLRPGGHLVWLDMVHPMYRKTELQLWGQVGICRSTNHRYRIVTFWQRRS